VLQAGSADPAGPLPPTSSPARPAGSPTASATAP
jgi:hypothetical protein